MRDLVIRFSGLKEGLHEFHYEVGDAFFEQIDYSEIKKAELTVDVQLEKRINMMILQFSIAGKVEVMCDKCTDDFYLKVKAEDELIYKFGDELSDDEKIVMIPDNEIDIDLSQPIYELTSLALPSRRVHPEGECNQEMLNAMDDYLMIESDEADLSNEDVEESEPSEENGVDNQEIDPRWEKLKNLKK